MDTIDTASRLEPLSTVTTRPGWRRLAARVGLGVVASLAIIAAAGAIYETIASRGDAAAHPMRGHLVDVGGYRLHLDCRGRGSPTVVMDAGLGGSSLDWTLVQPALAGDTRVCAYDRAGMGWSDAGPSPRSPVQIAEELHTLLRNAGEPGPYILVAHSLAGKTARLFAAADPAEVTGMVLVDARSERIDGAASKFDADAFSAALQAQANLYTVARRFGIARLFGASLLEQPLVPPAVASWMVLLQTAPAAIEEAAREGLARAADDDALAGTTLGAMPLRVIAAGESMRGIPGWASAQQALAALSSRGRLVIAAHSPHYVQLSDPNVVIAAVREVLADARAATR